MSANLLRIKGFYDYTCTVCGRIFYNHNDKTDVTRHWRTKVHREGEALWEAGWRPIISMLRDPVGKCLKNECYFLEFKETSFNSDRAFARNLGYPYKYPTTTLWIRRWVMEVVYDVSVTQGNPGVYSRTNDLGAWYDSSLHWKLRTLIKHKVQELHAQLTSGEITEEAIEGYYILKNGNQNDV